MCYSSFGTDNIITEVMFSGLICKQCHSQASMHHDVPLCVYDILVSASRTFGTAQFIVPVTLILPSTQSDYIPVDGM